MRKFRFEIVPPRQALSPDLAAMAKSFALHGGEMEALQIAQEQRGSILLSDDTAARLAGRSLGIAVHGTIGILLRALRRGHKSKEEILGVLNRIPEHSSLHLKRALLREIMLEVGHLKP